MKRSFIIICLFFTNPLIPIDQKNSVIEMKPQVIEVRPQEQLNNSEVNVNNATQNTNRRCCSQQTRDKIWEVAPAGMICFAVILCIVIPTFILPNV